MVEPLDTIDAGISALNVRRDERSDIELQLFLDALLRYGGYDFRFYNQAVLRRRIADWMRAHGLATISGLQENLLHDERSLAAFLVSMGGSHPQLFYEPSFFKAFATNVVPMLRTYSFVRVWIPTCGTGADAYSMAAVLYDAGLLERCVVYATTTTDVGVAVAKAGCFETRSPHDFTALVRQAGIAAPVNELFDVGERFASPSAVLRESVMFARHNLAEDNSINEFHCIIARGVLSLFNGAVQYRSHRLFYDSLSRLGFLALGSREALAGTVHERAYRQVTPDEAIFRRMR